MMMPGGRVHAERERQQQRDARRRPDARQRADQDADDHADHRHQQVEGRQRDREAEREVGEEVHRWPSTSSEAEHADGHRHPQPAREDEEVQRRRPRTPPTASTATALRSRKRISTIRNSAVPRHHADDVEQRDAARPSRPAPRAGRLRPSPRGQPRVAGIGRPQRADQQRRGQQRHHHAQPERQERRPRAVLAPVRIVLQRAGAEGDAPAPATTRRRFGRRGARAVALRLTSSVRRAR